MIDSGVLSLVLTSRRKKRMASLNCWLFGHRRWETNFRGEIIHIGGACMKCGALAPAKWDPIAPAKWDPIAASKASTDPLDETVRSHLDKLSAGSSVEFGGDRPWKLRNMTGLDSEERSVMPDAMNVRFPIRRSDEE